MDTEKRFVLTGLTVLFAAALAGAQIQVDVSSDPVDCNEIFRVAARFSTDTTNTRVVFYVDDYEFSSKNLANDSAASVTFTGRDWERLKPGSHTANARLYRMDSLLDSGSKAFEVSGRRCPEASTTTTTSLPSKPVNCRSNSDCMPPASEPTSCSSGTVTQILRWGECMDPGTPESVCVERVDNVTVESCYPDRICFGGRCQAQETTTTTTETTSTSTTQSSTTTSQPTTTTQATTTTEPAPVTTQTTQQQIFTRTNTRMDRLIEVLEDIIRFFLF
jgi:hypothetical protein